MDSCKLSPQVQPRRNPRRRPYFPIHNKPLVDRPLHLLKLLERAPLNEVLQRELVRGGFDSIQEPSLRHEEGTGADGEERLEADELGLDEVDGLGGQLEVGVGPGNEEVIEGGAVFECGGRGLHGTRGGADGLEVTEPGDVVPVDDGGFLDDGIGESDELQQGLVVLVDVVNGTGGVEPLVVGGEKEAEFDGLGGI